jgi:hypothetical protein
MSISYRLVKNSLGTNQRDILANIDLPEDISDFCFIPDFGYLFVLKNNHCISFLDLEGNFTKEWLGGFGENGYKDGSNKYARLNYPSSICYSEESKKAYLIEEGGASLRSIDLSLVYIRYLLGRDVISKLRQYISKFSLDGIYTSCCTSKFNTVYWTSDKLNRCFKFKQGEVQVILGDGRCGYSVSSDICSSRLYNPSGIFVSGKFVYVADKGNHCIRELTEGENGRLRLFKGTPVETNIIDAPTHLKSYKGLFYCLDNNKVKYFSSSGNEDGVVYEGDNVVGIELQGRNLLILEKEDA